MTNHHTDSSAPA